jgi:hypothetical protein
MHLSLLVLASLLASADDTKASRYGIAADLVAFPQKTPQETLGSVLKAVDAKRFDYLAAHLADPVFIDERVRRLYGGRFDEQVEATRSGFNAASVALLRRFLTDGAWQAGKGNTVVTLKDVTDRVVSFRLADGRWFMEHRNK